MRNLITEEKQKLHWKVTYVMEGLRIFLGNPRLKIPSAKHGF